jgi:hypothetical protein
VTELVKFDYAALDKETQIVLRERSKEIKREVRSAIEGMLHAGEALADVRARLASDGLFRGWLKAEFGWSRSTAYNFIAAYEAFGGRPNFGHLNIDESAIYLLARKMTPEAAVEEAIERAESGEHVTRSDVKDIIASHTPVSEATPTPTHGFKEGDTVYYKGRRCSILLVNGDKVMLKSFLNGLRESGVPVSELQTEAEYEAAQKKSGGAQSGHSWPVEREQQADPGAPGQASETALRIGDRVQTPGGYVGVIESINPTGTFIVSGQKAAYSANRLKRLPPTTAYAAFAEDDLVIGWRGEVLELYRANERSFVDMLHGRMANGVTLLAEPGEIVPIDLDDLSSLSERQRAEVQTFLDRRARTTSNLRIGYRDLIEYQDSFGVVNFVSIQGDRYVKLEATFLTDDCKTVERVEIPDPEHVVIVEKEAVSASLFPTLKSDNAAKLRDFLLDVTQHAAPSADSFDADLNALKRAYQYATGDSKEGWHPYAYGNYQSRQHLGALIEQGLVEAQDFAEPAERLRITRAGVDRLDAPLPAWMVGGSPVEESAASLDTATQTPQEQLKQQFKAAGLDCFRVVAHQHNGHAGTFSAGIFTDAVGDAAWADAHHAAALVRGLGFQVLSAGIDTQPGYAVMGFNGQPAIFVHFAEAGYQAQATAPAPALPSGSNAALFTSKSDERYSPPDFMPHVRAVLGIIDLDPASCAQANRVVIADRFYDRSIDGLKQPWDARNLYLNPPYGDEIDPFIIRAIAEYERGAFPEGILLVPARTDTEWFQRLKVYPRCFITGRLKFWNDDDSTLTTGAPFPSAVIYLGHRLDIWAREFSTIGDVYTFWSPTR